MAQATEKKITLEEGVAFEVLLEKVPELKEVKKLKKAEKKTASLKGLKSLRSKIKRPGKERAICIDRAKPNIYSRNFGLY